MSDDHNFPGAAGPVVWYLGKHEVIEIRMTSDDISGCFAAAETLDCRFFIRRHKLASWLGSGEPASFGWGVFDTLNERPANGHIAVLGQHGHQARPIKVFDTPTMDGAVMWAMMKESQHG